MTKEILDILKRSPFILEKLFESGEMSADFRRKYMFGGITMEEIAKIKEYFNK